MIDNFGCGLTRKEPELEECLRCGLCTICGTTTLIGCHNPQERVFLQVVGGLRRIDWLIFSESYQINILLEVLWLTTSVSNNGLISFAEFFFFFKMKDGDLTYQFPSNPCLYYSWFLYFKNFEPIIFHIRVTCLCH